MHPNQWLQRWQQNRIGFHEPVVNPHLIRYLPQFNLVPGDTLFLPLCGKAHDIVWLAQQGFQVIGIELSGIAIESFFCEHELQYRQYESERFILRESGSIRLIQGDYFDLTAQDLSACKLIYDRAALIAIEPAHQARYCTHMRSITPENSDMLLITLDYDQTQLSGPPWAVSDQSVEKYYQSSYMIERQENNDVLDEKPRWRDQGLTALTETVYKLTRNTT